MVCFKRWKIKRLIKKLKFLQANRVNNQPTDELLQKEISYYFDLAKLYKTLERNKKFPYAHLMQIECYRAAAVLDDAEANYQVGKMILDEAKFRETLDIDGVFQSNSNLKRYKQLYEEAQAYLLAAVGLNHSAAKRLRGLCFINGWGLEPNKKAGFELIISSIDQEGSWDKVPQIFASMGLNKPEFFSEIMQHRK